MPGQSVSIRTVAKRAGVSIATVSNVLNNRTSVGETLQQRVRIAVDQLGYVTDGTASRLRSRKQALAGVVVPDLKNPFFATFVSTLEQVARRDGFDLLVVSSANDPAQEAERLRAIRSWRPAGLIVLPCDGALGDRLPPLPGTPVVVVDRIPDEDGFDLVAVDNRRAAGSMIRHLAQQGARTCLVAGSTLAISTVRERWDGAEAAAAATGMRLALLESGIEPAAIATLLGRRLDAGPRPEALFALDHVTTLAAFRTLGDRRLRIPQDVALASFDDAEWMSLVTPALTAVSQPVEGMARAAWRRLAERMAGDTAPPEGLRLACAIAIRGSTARSPAGADDAGA